MMISSKIKYKSKHKNTDNTSKIKSRHFERRTHMKKRVWSLFLALALCLTMMPQTALAETSGGSAAGGEQDNVHAVAAQTADDGNTNGENVNESENCTHAQVTQNAENHNYYCEKCKKQMSVKVKATDGTTTYGTDPAAAMKTAANGTTITLLADIDNKERYLSLTGNEKTVTLNLNGCTINGGNIKVGINENWSAHTSSTLKIVGSGSFNANDGQINVGYNATLDLRNWGGGENDTIIGVFLSANAASAKLESTLLVEENMKGTIEHLYFHKWPSRGIKSKLYGGTYGQILIDVQYDSEPFSSLLAPGYAFQYTDEAHKGEFVEYTKTATKGDNTIHNVKVVKCPHAKVENNTCAYCGVTGIVATIGDTAYTDIDEAVAAWLASGGTLTLHDDAGKNAITSFSSASGKNLVIDLNGHCINDDNDKYPTPPLLNGANLTIRDSKPNDSEQGAFGPIVANSGSLTLESGYIKGLNVQSTDTATIHLRGGKVKAGEWCFKPIYALLDDGYALMNGSDTVDPIGDPTVGLEKEIEYTIKNAQITDKSGERTGSTSIGSGTLPFDLSLKTDDEAIGLMQFSWYCIYDNREPSLLAASADVSRDKDGVYRYDTTTNGNGKVDWTDLEANKTYDVICVAKGKTSEGTDKWQAVLKGYELTITPADLANPGFTQFTQVAETGTGLNLKGNIKSKDGTFVFQPWGGDLGNATSQTYCFEVAYNGKTLQKGVDYEIVSGDKATNAGTHTLTIKGKDNYTGTATHTWRIEPYTLFAEKPAITNIIKEYDGTDGIDADILENGWLGFAEDVTKRNVLNPVLGADDNAITINLTKDDFTISNFKFDSADAGDRTASFTITLRNGNLTFADGKRSADVTLRDQGSANISIKQAAAPTDPKGALTVYNRSAQTYTVDLNTLLPKLVGSRTYGKFDGSAVTKVELNGDYYHSEAAAEDSARIEDGKLLLPIQSVDSSAASAIGTITVHVVSQNYKAFDLTIDVSAANKPSSGGGGAAPAPTPAPVNPDVITVKEDTKDNTTSKPGAETDTTTTTKTTVKTTTTATTKNEQGQEVSKTTASVSKDLGDKLLEQAVSNKSNMIEITVKSSDANNNGGAGASAADSVKATEVELPKATVNAIAKDTNADLVIKTDNGEVVLDNKTLETIAGAAKGDTVTIVVGENTQLKETQKPAEKIVGKNGTLFDLAAKIGERLLHQFEGGKAHVTLPMPDKLKGKDVLVIYIDDNGLCKILNHSVEKIGAADYIRFTTTHFSTFAVVDKDEAERLIKEQNAAHVKELMQSAKFKVTTTKTSKKSVKVQVTAKSSKTLLSDIKSLGYTLKYQFYRSTKKTAGYKVIKTKAANTFTNTKGTKGTKYYYKARVLVYDGKTLVAKSALRQCGWGSRTWTK